MLISEEATKVPEDFTDPEHRWDANLLADQWAIKDDDFKETFLARVAGGLSEKERSALLKNHFWTISADGDLSDKPFGFIKFVGGHLRLYTFIPNFLAFCELMKRLNDYTQYILPKQAKSTASYNKYKWKQDFDAYLESLKGHSYFYGFVQVCLNYLDQRNCKFYRCKSTLNIRLQAPREDELASQRRR